MIEIFKMLLLTSCIGAILALTLAIFRPFTKKVFSAGWHYYMWLAVLLIMVLPIRITVPEPILPDVEQRETMVLPQAESENGEMVILDEAEPPMVQNLMGVVERERNAIKKLGLPVLFGVWITVALGLFFLRMVCYGLFLRKLRRKSREMDCPELKNYTSRAVRVRVSNSICSPLMIGVFRPTLLLPDTKLSPEQLHYVLSHECVHLKRQDVLYKWFLSMVKCIHWFNPAVYFIAKQVNLDCEISCDRAVVNQLDNRETSAYAETILALLSGTNSRQIPLTTGMTGKKKTLMQRLLMLKQNGKISKRMTILSILLALVVVAGAVLASGILNGKIGMPGERILGLNTEERQGDEFTILVEGVDPAGRPDAILLFHFDGKLLTGMSVPRNTEYIEEGDDTVRTIADYLAGDKNNHQVAIDAMRELFGIPVHYYAKVEIEAVEELVDSIGGLEFEVPYNMVYDDPYQDLHISLTAGRQHLTGEQVGHLLRFRDRSAENDKELRRMTWFSVIEEVLNQAVFGNRLPDVKKLYQAATEHMETNYPMEDFIKDLGKLQNSNRSNVVLKTVRGRNLVADGRFVFRINYVESEPLLQVFRAESPAEKLVSTITYTNEVMGFQLKLPEHWKSGYDAVQYHNQVVFYHKEIFEKYGKGSGMLFSITKLDRTEEAKMEELVSPSECLYWSKDMAYYWSIATDVQYPVWTDRDEEDEWLAEDFENMMKDINFIKNSFTFLENTEEYINLNTKATGTTSTQ